MWAMGQSLPVASERNGYRGDFTAGMHISGPDSATLELLRRFGLDSIYGAGSMPLVTDLARFNIPPAAFTGRTPA